MPLRLRYLICAAAVAIFSAAFAQNHAEPKSESSHTNSPSADSTITLPTSDEDLEQGRKLFVTHCAYCHGPYGEGAKGPTLAQPTLPRAGDDPSLIRIIREGIGGTEMPHARMERDEVLLVAGYVRSLGAKPRETVPGNPDQGAQIYRVKGACAQCHTLRGYGGAIGPDLTDVGRRRSAAYLRRALVNPNAEVPQSFSAFRGDGGLPENFLYVRIATQDGNEITGVRVNEDTFSIQIRDLKGQVHSFFKSDIELHKDYGVSPMPSYATLSTNELDDLVAFLVSLRAEK